MDLPIQIPSIVTKHRNKILNIGIVLLTLIIANNTYKGQSKSIQALRERIDIETKKNDALSNISQSEKIISAYKNLLNKKDISIAIHTISNIAKESDIKIVLLKPLAVDSQSAYIRYPFALLFNAPDYHKIGKFLNKLESHSDVYFVDKINIRLIDKDNELAKVYRQTVDLTVSTIIFKDK